jgi:hypothetical protein
LIYLKKWRKQLYYLMKYDKLNFKNYLIIKKKLTFIFLNLHLHDRDIPHATLVDVHHAYDHHSHGCGRDHDHEHLSCDRAFHVCGHDHACDHELHDCEMSLPSF